MLLLEFSHASYALPILFEPLGGNEPAKSEISYAERMESKRESILILNVTRLPSLLSMENPKNQKLHLLAQLRSLQKVTKPLQEAVGAVTQPAKGNETSTRGCGGNRPGPVSRRKSSTTRKVKHIPSRGQIDTLFRQQLSVGSDPPISHPDRATLVEDISDEEFEKHNDGQLLQFENIALTTGRVDQQDIAKDEVAQYDSRPSSFVNNAISHTDPIEEYSDDKNLHPRSQPANVNLLPSPVKHKRNTDRAAGNQAALIDNVNAHEERIEQFTPLEQELCTTELVQEGLMNGNSKKQRSISCDERDMPCMNNDRNKEDTTRAEPCQGLDRHSRKGFWAGFWYWDSLLQLRSCEARLRHPWSRGSRPSWNYISVRWSFISRPNP